MKGDEERVIATFCAWLASEGWSVTREVEFCDVVASRAGERLFAEAKGSTAATGLDVDTAYGQLLRRMPLDADDARFALVVPAEALRGALRVPHRVRDLLRLDVAYRSPSSTRGAVLVRDAEPVRSVERSRRAVVPAAGRERVACRDSVRTLRNRRFAGRTVILAPLGPALSPSQAGNSGDPGGRSGGEKRTTTPRL